MDGFTYKRGRLYCEDVPVPALAKRYGTPLYVYSRGAITARFREVREVFRGVRPLICYSVKANSNLTILRVLARLGAGFDIVSGGELFRVLKAGADPAKVVFAGVGKSPDEIRAGIEAGIRMFNVESTAELRAAERAARRLKRVARVALRLNPDVDPRTHAKTTTAKKENKFGIALDHAVEIFARRAEYPHLDICGIHFHLGSPIYSTAPFRRALRRATEFVQKVRSLGAQITTLNIGGGYCISYDGKRVIPLSAYARVIVPAAEKLGLDLILEPGRYVVGNSGIVVSRVIYVKEGWLGRRFVILDAGMNDLLRPALYGSYHGVWPVTGPPAPALDRRASRRSRTRAGLEKVDIVGPICETSDSFGLARRLPPVKERELVAIFSAGAYGLSMSSNYNSRPRPCEVLVSGKRSRLIRRRETYEDLIRGE